MPYLGGQEPLHSCSNNAMDVRQEVFLLRGDFNNRFKQIIFTSVLNAYYVSSHSPFVVLKFQLFFHCRLHSSQSVSFLEISSTTSSGVHNISSSHGSACSLCALLTSSQSSIAIFFIAQRFILEIGQNLDLERLTLRHKIGTRIKYFLMGVT